MLADGKGNRPPASLRGGLVAPLHVAVATCRQRLGRWIGSFRRRRENRALRPLLAEFGRHERALADVASEIERSFTALGTDLQEQARLSKEMVRAGEQLAARAAGEPGDPVRAATAVVQRTLVFVEQCGHRIEALIGRLEGYHDQTGRLLDEERKVEGILAPLRVIQTLFRIEATRPPAEARAGFAAVAGEIPRFEQAVRTTFRQHAEALALTRQSLQATVMRLRERAEFQRRDVASKHARIQASLADLERELDRSRKRDARLAAILREIDCATGEIVVGLQYQDITRQKTEHVRAALSDLCSQSDPRGSGPLTPGHQIAAACRIQAFQAAAIQQELAQSLGRIRAGVDDILRHLDAIERECWPRQELAAVSHAVAQRVGNLRAMMAEAGALMPLAVESASKVVEVVGSFGHVAADVAATAREMAENMRLIALNAQVLSAQAGQHGAGLLILAERTYTISQEICGSTQSIAEEFFAASRHRAAVLADCEEIERLAKAQQAALDGGAGSLGETLDCHGREIAGLLSRVGGLLENTHQRLHAMQQALDLEAGWEAPFAELRQHFEAVAQTCEPSFAGRREPPADLGDHHRRYTMESERATHARATAPEQMATASPPDVFATASLAGRDDNVELF